MTARCPLCGGRSLTLYERLEVAHVFRVEDGVAQPMRRDEGFPIQIGFSALCDCGHSWTPRRPTALRIMDEEADAHAGRAALDAEGER